MDLRIFVAVVVLFFFGVPLPTNYCALFRQERAHTFIEDQTEIAMLWIVSVLVIPTGRHTLIILLLLLHFTISCVCLFFSWVFKHRNEDNMENFLLLFGGAAAVVAATPRDFARAVRAHGIEVRQKGR